MSVVLLKALRNLAQDCETIGAAARKALREIEAADVLGMPMDAETVETHVARLERRMIAAANRIGVEPRKEVA